MIQVLKILKPVTEYAVKNAYKIIATTGTIILSTVGYKVGNEKGKTEGYKEGRKETSKEFEKKFQKQENDFKNKYRDIESKMNN